MNHVQSTNFLNYTPNASCQCQLRLVFVQKHWVHIVALLDRIRGLHDVTLAGCNPLKPGLSVQNVETVLITLLCEVLAD